MWQLLSNLVSGFLLLRDVFGYVIPGAVLLAIVAHTRQGATHPAVSDTPWFGFLILLLAAYVIGQILVAIGYSFYGGLGMLLRRGPSADPNVAADQNTDLQYYRYLYPAMFTERDRRATINILRIGLAVAFIAGAWLMPAMPLLVGMLVIGLLMLSNGYTGMKHVETFGNATIAAGRRAEEKKVPFFSWSPDAKPKTDGAANNPGGGPAETTPLTK
jgi:hypothetical protein